MKKNSVKILFVFVLAILAGSVSCSFNTPVDDGPTFEEQLAADLVIIDGYLLDNEITAEEHSSGIRYVVHAEGEGVNPGYSSQITTKYVGKLLDGTVFDSNDTGYTAILNELISSWRIMLPLMKVGGSVTMYAPSVYCYGKYSSSTIPPYSNMIFEIELTAIN